MAPVDLNLIRTRQILYLFKIIIFLLVDDAVSFSDNKTDLQNALD